MSEHILLSAVEVNCAKPKGSYVRQKCSVAFVVLSFFSFRIFRECVLG